MQARAHGQSGGDRAADRWRWTLSLAVSSHPRFCQAARRPDATRSNRLDRTPDAPKHRVTSRGEGAARADDRKVIRTLSEEQDALDGKLSPHGVVLGP